MLHFHKVHVFLTSWNWLSHRNFIIDIYLIIQVSHLILLFYLAFSFSGYWLVDPVFIEIIRLTAGLSIEIREFGKDHLMHIRALQGIAHYIFKSSVNPLAFLFVNYIVVAYDLVTFLFFDPFVGLLENTCTWLSISNSNLSFPNHVHFINFLVFIVNYHIISVVPKSSWDQTGCNVIYECIVLHGTSWIFRIVKESSVFIYHICKQIFNSNFRFDF